MQGNSVADKISDIVEAISSERLKPFTSAAGQNVDRALELYLWNAALCSAFYLPLHAVEIALRNRLAAAMRSNFGEEWWNARDYLGDAPVHEHVALRRATASLLHDRRPLTHDSIISDLSLGYWVGLIDSRFDDILWRDGMRSVFPAAPETVNRSQVSAEAQAIRKLRNGISHHEPIFARDLSGDFSRLMRFLGWLSPAKASWIRPHCRIPALLRQKP